MSATTDLEVLFAYPHFEIQLQYLAVICGLSGAQYMSDAELLLVPVVLSKLDRRSISAFGMRGIDGAATTGGEDARDDEWVRLAEMEEGGSN